MMKFTAHTVRRIANESDGRHLYNEGAAISNGGTRYISTTDHGVRYGGDGARAMICYLAGYGDYNGTVFSDGAADIVNAAWNATENAHVLYDWGTSDADKERRQVGKFYPV